MRITIIHPCIGRHQGKRYIRSWQMEPLPAARIAALTPSDVEVRFYDDRMERIPLDEPTDLVAISVETYTAMRSYQIASEYRNRRVPVVMGGFHATLCPDEVARYAEAVVVGEADTAWPLLIDDFQHGKLKKVYHGKSETSLSNIHFDRSIFRDKRYLPIGLVETARGCSRNCEFCAIQTFFERNHQRRSFDEVIKELQSLRKSKTLFFFVDDNFVSDLQLAKDFLRELIPLRIRWVTQMSADAAHDEEFLDLLNRSGCQGVLIGFESLDPATLGIIRKVFATKQGSYFDALKNLRRHSIRVYGTFIFGNDLDTKASFDKAINFAIENQFYIAAFNHLTPFPGTPLYSRLQEEGRLTNPAWWLDSDYRYNMVPFTPKLMTPDEVRENCLLARKKFYSMRSIVQRGFTSVNRAGGFMFRHFFPINFMHRVEISVRDGYPLGDEAWQGQLVEAV